MTIEARGVRTQLDLMLILLITSFILLIMEETGWVIRFPRVS